MFRLITVNKQAGAKTSSAINESIASFHRLTAKEKAAIHQQRLRIIPARLGETLTAFLERAGSDWDKESCAIANNLETGVKLKKGQLIKVVISEPF